MNATLIKVGKSILTAMVVVILACGGGCKKPTDIATLASQIISVTVYDIGESESYSTKSLATAFQAPLDVNFVKELLPQAKYHRDRFFWTEGSSLAVVKLNDGTEKKIALAYNGGFWIVGEKGYYVLEGEARGRFEKAFNKGIIQDIFIPKRMERKRTQGKE